MEQSTGRQGRSDRLHLCLILCLHPHFIAHTRHFVILLLPPPSFLTTLQAALLQSYAKKAEVPPNRTITSQNKATAAAATKAQVTVRIINTLTHPVAVAVAVMPSANQNLLPVRRKGAIAEAFHVQNRKGAEESSIAPLKKLTPLNQVMSRKKTNIGNDFHRKRLLLLGIPQARTNSTEDLQHIHRILASILGLSLHLHNRSRQLWLAWTLFLFLAHRRAQQARPGRGSRLRSKQKCRGRRMCRQRWRRKREKSCRCCAS